MARIVFKKPEAGTYTPLPEGLYDWEIKDVKQTTSGNGNPQLELSCECAGPDQYVGRNTKMWYSLLPQSGWRVKKLLDATDVTYEEGTDEAGGEVLAFDDEDLLGRVFACKATMDESPSGNPRNKFSNEAPSKLAKQPPAPAAAAPAPAQTAPAQTAAAPAAAPAQGGAFQPRARRA